MEVNVYGCNPSEPSVHIFACFISQTSKKILFWFVYLHTEVGWKWKNVFLYKMKMNLIWMSNSLSIILFLLLKSYPYFFHIFIKENVYVLCKSISILYYFIPLKCKSKITIFKVKNLQKPSLPQQGISWKNMIVRPSSKTVYL